MTLTTGTKLGPYEILAPLGAGGMGEVYRAKDTRLGREVAVKVLPSHLSSHRDLLRRPDQIGNPNGSPCQPGTFFNACAFADPPLGSFGNAGRNTLQAPGFQSWDLSLFKTFNISERKRLEFRTEFFNFPNHPNLLLAKSGPQTSNNATTLNTPECGFLTAARPPRQIQFALKLYF